MNELRYANNENGKLIHISEVNKENRYDSKYYCIGCESELITRLGEIKEHHFCHKNKGECNGETYLHKTAKLVFYNRYIECLEKKEPYYISYDVLNKCNINPHCIKKLSNSFDLTSHFDLIKMGKKEGKFIPDILLYSSKYENKIFIEMKVTHGLSEEKMNSGYKIIEYTIEQKDIEEDFEFMNYEFYNFNFHETNKCHCEEKSTVFVINSKNELGFYEINAPNILKYPNKYYEFPKPKMPWYRLIFERHKERKINVKHCILCKFSKLTDKNDLYCNIKKSKLSFNESKITCKSLFYDTKINFDQKYMRPYDDSVWDN